MGVFNKAIPKYTGNIYNEVVVEPVEEQPTFVDDIFDPILNKAVRDRLMSQYGNPIGATLGGYAELINSSIMGNRHQGGNTLPGLGILTSFGRSMDKAGDVILGSLTETVKGVTGQGVESPFYNIFTEDEDYSGQRLLAASANSMAKLARAPELTEADFGGVWTIPALGIDLATDPSILGTGLSKIANGTGAVADMGRLLQDYDDLMAKVAIDVTAPGVRPLAKKVGAHVSSLISNHRSEQGLTDQIIYLDNILKRAEMAYGDGSMPKEQFDAIMSDIAERIQRLNDAMAKDITDVNLSKIKTDTDTVLGIDEPSDLNKLTSNLNNVRELADVKEHANAVFTNIDDTLNKHNITVSELVDILDKTVPKRAVDTVDYLKIYQDDPELLFKNLGLNTEGLRTGEGVGKQLELFEINKLKKAISEFEENNVDFMVNYDTFKHGLPENPTHIDIRDYNLAKKHLDTPRYKSLLQEYNSLLNELNAFTKVDYNAAWDDSRLLELIPPNLKAKYNITSRQDLLDLLSYDLTIEQRKDLQKWFSELKPVVDDTSGGVKISQSLSKAPYEVQVLIHNAQQDFIAEFITEAVKIGLVDPKTISTSTLDELFDEMYSYILRYSTKENTEYNAFSVLNHYRNNEQYFKNKIKVFADKIYNAKDIKKVVKVKNPKTGKLENVTTWVTPVLKSNARTNYNSFDRYVNSLYYKIGGDLKEFAEAHRGMDYTSPEFLEELSKFLDAEIFPNAGITRRAIADDILNDEYSGAVPYTRYKSRFSELTTRNKAEPYKSFSEFGEFGKFLREYANRKGKPLNELTGSELKELLPTKLKYDKLYNIPHNDAAVYAKRTAEHYQKVSDMIGWLEEHYRIYENTIGSKVGGRIFDDTLDSLKTIGTTTSETSIGFSKAINEILSRIDFEDPISVYKFMHKKFKTSQGMKSLSDLGFEVTNLPKHMLNDLQDISKNSFTKFVKYNDTDTTLMDVISKGVNTHSSSVLAPWDSLEFKNADEVSKIISKQDFEKYFEGTVDMSWNEFVRRVSKANVARIVKNPALFRELSDTLQSFSDDIDDIVDLANIFIREEGNLGIIDALSVLQRKKIIPHHLIDYLRNRGYKNSKEFLQTLENTLYREAFINTLEKQGVSKPILDALRNLPVDTPEFRTSAVSLVTTELSKEQVLNDIIDPNVYLKSWLNDYRIMKTDENRQFLNRLRPDLGTLSEQDYLQYVEDVKSEKYNLFKFNNTNPGANTYSFLHRADNKFVKKILQSRDSVIEDEMATMFTNDDIANVVTGKVNLFEEADLTAKVKLLNDMFPDRTPLTELDLKMYFDSNGGKNPIIRYIEENHPEQIRFLDLVAREFKLSNLSRQDRNAILSLPEIEELLESAKTFNEMPGLKKSQKRKIFTLLDKSRGSVVKGEDFLTDLLFANGIKLMAFDTKREMKLADTLRQAIEANIKLINDAVGKPVIELVDQVDNMRVVGYRMVGSQKDWKKVGTLLNKLHFNDIVFEAPKNLTTAELKFLETTGAGAIDVLKRTQRLASDYYRKLGYDYNDPGYFKHTFKNTDDFQKHVGREYYKGIDIDTSESLADMVLSLDYLGDFRGTYNVLPNSRTFEGNISRYGDMFSTELETVVKGTFTKGIFANEKFQTTMSIFTNKEFKIGTYFKNVEDLKTILNSEGNIRNLTLAAPKYNDDGVLVGFTKFDNYSDYSLSKALENPDTVFIPTHIFATLDKACKHKARMSNKLYAFVNRYITAPFKVGILLNPGFLLGNMNDAYLKQASTMAKKYGTSVAQELTNVAVAIRSVMYLNNTFGDIYDKYLKFMKDSGVELGADFKIPTQVANSKSVRDTFIEFLNKNPKVLTEEENNIARAWIYLNILQPTEGVTQELLGDVGKLNYARNGFDRLLYGLRNYKNTKPETWGLLNTPPTKALFKTSESIESTMRAASILNDLRHQGLDLNAIGKELRIPHDSEFEVKMLNAINAMHNANFDYNATSPVLDAIDGFVPFPTFWLKNISYWFDMFMNHPQYIDHALSVNEGLWANEDTSEDEFKADAKARGAIPMSAVSGQKLSNFFKGIYKPSPLQSMFTAFNAMENPIENLTQRVHPLVQGAGVAAETMLKPYNLTTNLYDPEDVRYRPYNTNQYQPNIKLNSSKFNPLTYTAHKLNPFDRAINTGLRTPGKVKRGEAQLSDFFPSVFQPDFGKK